MSESYKAENGEDKSFDIEIRNGSFVLDGESLDLDIEKVGKDQWNVLHNSKSYNIELLAFNSDTKTVKLAVNDEILEFKIKNKLDLLLDKMGISATGTDQLEDVKAPMPGLVLKILVEKGQTISVGDPLLILEAMKMENVIKASGSGTIKSILVKNQDIVDKNQILIEVE